MMRSKIKVKFRNLHPPTPPVKIRDGVDKIYVTKFKVQPKAQPLIYFWSGAALWAG